MFSANTHYYANYIKWQLPILRLGDKLLFHLYRIYSLRAIFSIHCMFPLGNGHFTWPTLLTVYPYLKPIMQVSHPTHIFNVICYIGQFIIWIYPPIYQLSNMSNQRSTSILLILVRREQNQNYRNTQVAMNVNDKSQKRSANLMLSGYTSRTLFTGQDPHSVIGPCFR